MDDVVDGSGGKKEREPSEPLAPIGSSDHSIPLGGASSSTFSSSSSTSGMPRVVAARRGKLCIENGAAGGKGRRRAFFFFAARGSTQCPLCRSIRERRSSSLSLSPQPNRTTPCAMVRQLQSCKLGHPHIKHNMHARRRTKSASGAQFAGAKKKKRRRPFFLLLSSDDRHRIGNSLSTN